MLIWLPSSQKQARAGERGVQRPHSFSLEGLLRDNYKLYDSTQQKVEETPSKKKESWEKKITFPLYLCLMPPFNKRWGWCGWRRPSSGGIPGLFRVRQTETRVRVQPILCLFHSLRQKTHTPQWPESAFNVASSLMKRWAEMRLHHLNSLAQNPLASHNTKENILSFIQVYSLPVSPFSVFSPTPPPPNSHCVHYAECLNAVNYLKGKVCTCWKGIHAC